MLLGLTKGFLGVAIFVIKNILESFFCPSHDQRSFSPQACNLLVDDRIGRSCAPRFPVSQEKEITKSIPWSTFGS